MAAVKEYGSEVGIAPLCRALGVSRTSLWRAMKPKNPQAAETRRSRPERALTKAQRQTVLDIMHEERFVDMPPLSLINVSKIMARTGA